MNMTGLGTLLFLAGIGVLIFGIRRSKRGIWPRKKTQIVILSSILAIIIGVGIIPSAEDEAATEKPKQEEKTKSEKTKKEAVKTLLKAEKSFTTDDNGTIVIEGKTNPGAEVKLVLEDSPESSTTADDKGAFSISLNEFDHPSEALLSITIDGKTKEQTLSLEVSEGYETKLAAKAEEERIAAEKAENERIEKERIAAEEQQRIAEEKRAAEAKIAADKKAAEEAAKIAAEKKAAEDKRVAAERAAAKPDTSNEQGQMVYITEHGKRYHYDQNCRGLNNSNGETAVTVSDAQSRGLTLCKFEQ
ncbi:hypothetical protein [Listeria immobilis]|nr:hypothetical protein [Listeria immobilis]